ncbi:MAG: ABC transporter permease [Pirellulales bacterium]
MTLAELKTVGKLVLAQAWHRPGRVFITSLSTIIAACIVVWVVSGYDSMVSQFGGMGDEYVGRYELVLVPRREEQDAPVQRASLQLPKELLDSVGKDPEVQTVEPAFETTARYRHVGQAPTTAARNDPTKDSPMEPMSTAPTSGPRIMGGMAQLRGQSKVPTLVGTDSTESLHTLVKGRWFDPKKTDVLEGAITKEAAEELAIKLGDQVIVSGVGGSATEATVTVVAIVEQPKRLPGPIFMVGLPPSRSGALPGGPAVHAFYLPTKLTEKISGVTAKANYAGVVLKTGVNVENFIARWSSSLITSTPPVEARSPSSVNRDAANSTTFETVRAQAWSATGISLMAALFIIFTTLSMGVDERVRQFAMLRSVAFTKSQIAVMVTMESLMLGLIGWAGGLLAGWGLLTLMARFRPEALSEGASLGWWCVILSGICAIGGSLIASILPAWRATRVSPLEAMSPRSSGFSATTFWVLTIVSLVLIAVNPLVVFFWPMSDTSRYGISVAVGCTSMILGFILLTPLIVVLVEKLLSPLLAKLLGLNRVLLATQLSANMWRTVGTTVAMTIGLGLFVATQIWGYSMLAPFTPGNWAPEMVISISPSGVPDSEIKNVQAVKGLSKDHFLPLAVKQVKFADDPTGFKIRPSATRQDNCMMVGVNLEAAFTGEKPLFKFDFVEGNLTDALGLMKKGRYCLVPDHFTRESGLGLGKKFRVYASNQDDEPIEYEIAGVVSMPGWHWLTKAGFRRGRAAGLMFCDYDKVRNGLETGNTTLFWGNLDGTSSSEQIKEAVQVIANRHFDPAAAQRNQRPLPEGVGGGRRGNGPRREAQGPTVTLQSAEDARKDIRQRADNIIWALSELPLVTLLVTSLGLINTVLSSIRARRWNLGVMRALGLTRFSLFRLITAEAVLIGIVACLVSLAFGMLAGYCGTGVTRYVNIRGGQVTPLIVPWLNLSVGFAIALLLCIVASVWPAFRTGRTEPLELLQAGRAAL